MKIQLKVILLVMVACVACNPNKMTSEEKISKDTYIEIEKKTPVKEEVKKVTVSNQKEDSIQYANVLKAAFNLAKKHSENTFHRVYDTVVKKDTTYLSTQVRIDVGNHFSKSVKDIVIQRSYIYTTNIDVFFYKNKEWNHALSHEQSTTGYHSDSIADINNDGIKDLIIEWSPTSGCCLKNFSYVFIVQPDKASSTKKFKFSNPTFSPKEKIVRGVCYGHKGHTAMYKFKWKGSTLDTVEYVYHEKKNEIENTGMILVAKKAFTADTTKVKRLKSVPKEYTTIYGYDWFEGILPN